MNGSAFSSPVLAEIHGRKQVLVQTRTDLCSVDPDDGTLIWKKEVEAFRGLNILNPTVWKDQVFTSSYGGKAWLFGFEPSSTGGGRSTRFGKTKFQAYMSSPVVVNDVLYLHLRNQRFTAIDMQFLVKSFGRVVPTASTGALSPTARRLWLWMKLGCSISSRRIRKSSPSSMNEEFLKKNAGLISPSSMISYSFAPERCHRVSVELELSK